MWTEFKTDIDHEKRSKHKKSSMYCFLCRLYLRPQAFSSSDWMNFSVSLAPTYSSIVEVKLVMPCGQTPPPSPTPSVVRLPSARLARIGLFLAELLWKLQSSTDRFAHTPLCWQTLGDPAPVKPSLRPTVCCIHVWQVVVCPNPQMLLCYNRNSWYFMSQLCWWTLLWLWSQSGSGRIWLRVMNWFVVAWIRKVSMRQMAYFWLEIMLLVGKLFNWSPDMDQLGFPSPWFELNQG